MTPTLSFDFSPTPTKKQRAQLERRLRRMQVAGFDEHLDSLVSKLESAGSGRGHLAASGLALRRPFSYLKTSIAGDSSDRKAPPHAVRPPATRISSSRGSALRLELIAIALVQLSRRAGNKARLADLGLTIAGSTQSTGWADLVAAKPADSNIGGHYTTSRDKRARTVREALETLEGAGLVDLVAAARKRDRFENFVLLNETGAEALGERVEYTVPGTNEPQFHLPPGFVLNNWMHVLEDSEIATLLMVACRDGAWEEDGRLAFSGEVRLRRYGIHRDPYAGARKTLEWLGLLDVREVGRHDDGRAENDERLLHRIQLVPGAFDRPALPAVREMLEYQLGR